MAIARHVVVIAFLLAASSAAKAQVEVAPPPHPTLDEVVKEYLRLELPLPPKDAVLVRVKLDFRESDPDGPIQYWLGFRTPTKHRYDIPGFFVGFRAWSDEEVRDYLLTREVEVMQPSRDEFQDLAVDDWDLICTAVHCKLRGWDELACALYSKSRETLQDSPTKQLHKLAWANGKSGLHVRGSDRAKIYKQLQKLDEFDTDHHGGQMAYYPHLLKHLELTIAPRKSKPGTAESMIDDLVDYWHDWYDPKNESGRESYLKLVEMGFDAVPALIAHLNDERYTYALADGFAGFVCRPVSVGDLAGEILYRLAGGKMEGVFLNDPTQRGIRLDPKLARNWWEKTCKIDEAKWLVDHAGFENNLRALGAKYPKRLQELYRAALNKRTANESIGFAVPILASRLSRAEKLELFEAGVASPAHSLDALEGLMRFDRKVAQTHVVRLVLQQPDLIFRNVPLVLYTDDRECWEAAAAVWMRKSYDEKSNAIRSVGFTSPAKRSSDPLRLTRLRFLVVFIDDATSDTSKYKWDVRDRAAAELAGLLGLNVKRDIGVDPDQGLGPLSRVFLRARAFQVATKELERLRK